MTSEDYGIEIGDNLCFVAKDDITYKTVAIGIDNEEDLEKISGFFNNKEFIQAFKADSLKDAIDLANDFITRKIGEKNRDLENIHKDKKKFENPPGYNSYYRDKDGNIIKLVPQRK